MSECEICGRQTETLYEVNVEGAVMLACAKCSKGKNVIREIGEAREQTRSISGGYQREPVVEEEVVENYGEIIRKAREALGLPLSVLAEKISEKESNLARIEKQATLPTEKTRKKLERELGIKLVVAGEAKRSVIDSDRKEPISLWDAAEKKDK